MIADEQKLRLGNVELHDPANGFYVEKVEGLFDPPTPVFSTGKRLHGQGAWATSASKDATTGVITGHVVGESPFDRDLKIRSIMEAAHVSADPNSDTFDVWGHRYGWDVVCHARLAERALSEYVGETTYRYQLPLIVPDGRLWLTWDGEQFKTRTLALASTSEGGLTVPFTVPFKIASGGTDSVWWVWNPGQTGAWEFEFSGQMVGPGVVVSNSQGIFNLGWAGFRVADGAKLVADTLTRQAVYHQSPAPPTAWEWPTYAPSWNFVRFYAESASESARLTVRSRVSWW